VSTSVVAGATTTEDFGDEPTTPSLERLPAWYSTTSMATAYVIRRGTADRRERYDHRAFLPGPGRLQRDNRCGRSYAFNDLLVGDYLAVETDQQTTRQRRPTSCRQRLRVAQAPRLTSATSNCGGQGAITGVVFNDLDGNGVRDRRGRLRA